MREADALIGFVETAPTGCGMEVCGNGKLMGVLIIAGFDQQIPQMHWNVFNQ
jgi:hypothetical protein